MGGDFAAFCALEYQSWRDLGNRIFPYNPRINAAFFSGYAFYSKGAAFIGKFGSIYGVKLRAAFIWGWRLFRFNMLSL